MDTEFFDATELKHLLVVLREYRETGDYHGRDRAAWWTRHEQLIEKLKLACRLAAAAETFTKGDGCR